MSRESRDSEADVAFGDPRSWEQLQEEPLASAPHEQDFARRNLTFEARYEILETIAARAHSEVRRAHDRPFARDVVMKVLPMATSNHTLRWRFIREARIQGQLAHPGVVRVHDLGVDPEGDLFFTMERVRGVTFRTEQAPGHDSSWWLERFSKVCRTLDYAHGRGVVHRDVKPSNVMVGRFGEVFVLDWGLAKLRSSASDPIADASGAKSTSEGTIMGTIGYAAPEQLRGEVDVDASADVYSLGVMLFELLVGEPFLTGSLAERTVAALTTDGARPNTRRPDLGLPSFIDEACTQATRAVASDRVLSAEDLAVAVDRFREEL